MERWERRDAKHEKRRKMGVSGASVRLLQSKIIEKAKEAGKGK